MTSKDKSFAQEIMQKNREIKKMLQWERSLQKKAAEEDQYYRSKE